MAVLETIRQKKKILAIVIGGALLAFIVEVAFEALGRQASNSTAAKVGSEKIDIMAFQKRVELETSRDQNNQQNTVDQALRQQQVLESMISEKLLEKEYKAVGIEVSDNEITELMVGKRPAQPVAQMAQQVGAETPAQLYDFISNPKKYGADEASIAALRNQWELLKDDLTNQYKYSKLATLVMGGLQANDLDRAQMVEEESNICYVDFVKKDYASLDDAKYAVSDAELKAEWEKSKNEFTLDEETRYVHFITLNIDPSDADKADAKKVADAAYAALQKGRGIDSVRVLGTVKIDTARMTLAQVPAGIKTFVGGEVGAVTRDTTVAPGSYKMYKLMAKASSIDSVKVTFVGVPGAKSAQDSAMAMLNAGKTIDDVAKAFKGAQGQADQWLQVASYPDSLKTKIENAGDNYFALVANEQGAQLMKVVEKKAPKTFYTVATVTYEAFASAKTSDGLRDKLQQFLNKNKTAADFQKNAAAAGFQAMETQITGSTPQLGMNPYTRTGIKDTRKAIKWAMEGKKGEVSPIFSDNNDMLIVVAIDDIYDGDYAPWNAKGVKEELTTRVRNSKKGDDLMKQYNGKASDLAGYAKAMGVQVDTTQVIFGSDRAAKLESEPGIIGRVAAASKGKVVGLWKGQTGVYAFVVEKTEKSERKPSKQELNQRYAQTRGGAMVAQGLTQILGRATKVERHLIDFY